MLDIAEWLQIVRILILIHHQTTRIVDFGPVGTIEFWWIKIVTCLIETCICYRETVTPISNNWCFLKIFILRVFLSIFDLTLKTHLFWTDGARPNPFFLLKHLTQKVFDDSISADFAPTSGSDEQPKIKTSNAIGFRYRRAEVSWLVSFDCIF